MKADRRDQATTRCSYGEIIDAITRSNEKIETYSKKADEKMDKVSAENHGFSRTTASRNEHNHCENEGRRNDRNKQFNERSTNMERKIPDMDEKYENRSDEPRGAHRDQNQGKAVETGFQSETFESEVEQLLKETITEIGMSIENARIEWHANPITNAFIYFKSDDERNKYIRSANMLRKS